MQKIYENDVTPKPGRPSMGAPLSERVSWSLWQCWAHHPQDNEARRALDLVQNELAQIRRLEKVVSRVEKWPRWLKKVLGV
jgi:hypothetical protein